MQGKARLIDSWSMTKKAPAPNTVPTIHGQSHKAEAGQIAVAYLDGILQQVLTWDELWVGGVLERYAI